MIDDDAKTQIARPLSGKERAELVSHAISHLHIAHDMLIRAGAMCADNVADTLTVVKHRYDAYWSGRDD